MYGEAIAYNYHLYRKEFISAVIALIGVLMISISLIMAPTASAISIGGPSDCHDNNAIIDCGVHSTAALKNAYNSSAYVRGVYSEFGISQADISNLDSTNVTGRVTKNGNVFVDGQSKAVATDAWTAGRADMQPGSTKVNNQGAISFRRHPNVSFQQDSLPAFVSMNNGRFQFAVIASCGNPVSATPTTPPQQHTAVAPAKPVSKPQHKQPAPTAPAPSQNQEVNVSNTNVNQNVNSQTQVNKQPAPTVEQTPATTQSETAEAPAAAQPATQTSGAVLPNTGPTGVIGVFLAAVGLGTLGYRWLLLRRLTH